MEDLPVPAPADPAHDIASLAARFRRANGPVMRLVNRLGGSLEGQMALVPPDLRDRIGRVTEQALMAAYGLAGHGPAVGERGSMVVAMASGAAGGAGGLATTVAELPVTITLILQAVRAAAAEAGFDPADDWVRAECLQVFAAGTPLAGDDGVNTSFLSARLTITGPVLQKIIATVAPKLAAAMGQKLVAQAVPVLGALSGATLNAAFLHYYREVARIRFALLRLTETHGTEAVIAAFAKAVAPPKITRG